MDRLGKYKIYFNIMKKGSFGRVYYAKEIHSQREVAIKQSSKIEMAKHEAFVMGQYGVHPSLPEFYDFFIIDNNAYIIMEWFSGDNIGNSNFRFQGKKRKRKEAILITLNLLRGLQHLHSKGFLHRDTLPKNVMIKSNNNTNILKIVDFGLAKKINPLKANKDLYNAARMCIYLLNGYVSKTPENDLELLDDDLQKVLYKGIILDKEKQYSSAEEFINALLPLV